MKLILSFIVIQLTLSFSVYAEAEAEWVSVEPAMRQVTITGFTRASSKMPLAAEEAGKVKQIFADIGEAIPPEGNFACLDDTFIEIDIKSAQNEISQNGIDIHFHKKEQARHQKLTKKQTVALNVLDQITRDLGKSRRAYTAAVIDKQRLEERKLRHCIAAPAGWLVIDKSIEPKQWVNKGDIVAHIGDYSGLKVPITLSALELATLKSGQQKLEVLLTDYNIKVLAEIDHISPAFDEKTRKTQVDLLLKENLPEFHGGMRAEVFLNTPQATTSFTISKQALEERFEEYWLQRKDGKRLRVKLLSDQADGKVKIKSSEIKLGDQFKIIRQ
jgi:RND family efflux transporter MFP subunit